MKARHATSSGERTVSGRLDPREAEKAAVSGGEGHLCAELNDNAVK
jgi:hypothetical protein